MDDDAIPLGFLVIPTTNGVGYFQRSLISMVLPTRGGCEFMVDGLRVVTSLTAAEVLYLMQNSADRDDKIAAVRRTAQAQDIARVTSQAAMDVADAADAAANGSDKAAAQEQTP